MRCGVEIKALHEKEAIINLQKELIEDGDYMTELLSIDEVNNDEDLGEWSIKDGPVLEPEYQDALNDAMLNMVNEDGMTLKQVWDKEIEESKNK
tara:strand:+ start:60 stop:341 length:282 start_codon:yes stop_codon:yes gene_type:complete